MTDYSPELIRSLRRIAEREWLRVLEASGSRLDAVEAIRRELAVDVVFRDALVLMLLDREIKDAVRWAESRREPRTNSAQKIYDLLDFQLSSGCLLRNATRPILQLEVNEELRQSRKHLATAKWLRAISEHLPDDNVKVGDLLTDFQVSELKLRSERFGTKERPVKGLDEYLAQRR